MIAENLYHANLKITGDGLVSLESAWLLTLAEPAEAAGQLLAEARVWAGAVGDPFRVPLPDGSYEFSDRLTVTAIEFKPVNAQTCRVIYSGTGFEAASGEEGELLQPVAVGETVDTRGADGSLERRRRFRVPAGTDDSLIPKPGTPLEWEGGAFVCVECTVNDSGAAGCEFEVTSREVTTFQLGLPERGIDDDGFETRSVVWFVSAEVFEEFLSAHPVGGAEEWAGENFLLVSAESKPFGKAGYEVTLLARKVETRCISRIRTESFAGLSRAGAIRRKIVWNARWRVAAGELPTFFGLTGTAPTEWPEANCLITDVTPKRLSPMEYEVAVEVQHRNNPGLFERYSVDDRSDLSTRTDIAVDMADFQLTASMAGYQMLTNGKYMPIPNWPYGYNCPFVVSSWMPEGMIDITLRCLVLTVSTYEPGDVKSRINELVEWTGNRIQQPYLEGIPGSYLKIRQTCRELFDDEGNLFTRITRSYQRAPGDYSWNGNYWNVR